MDFRFHPANRCLFISMHTLKRYFQTLYEKINKYSYANENFL